MALTAIFFALLTVSTGLALRKSFCQRQQMGEWYISSLVYCPIVSISEDGHLVLGCWHPQNSLFLFSMPHKCCTINGPLDQVLHPWIPVASLVLASDASSCAQCLQIHWKPSLTITHLQVETFFPVVWIACYYSMKLLCGRQVNGRTGRVIQKWVSWNGKTAYGSLPKRQYFIEMIFKPPSAEIQPEYWRHLK